MHCPFCQAQDSRVIDSRVIDEGHKIRRRRECISCNERFTTYEMAERSLPRLIKQDGSYVQFKEEKIRAGILRALEKRSVSIEKVDEIIQKIILQLCACGERELSTSILGEWVMLELKKLDEVAYVRFASVYRRFKDVDAFYKEIAHLKKEEV